MRNQVFGVLVAVVVGAGVPSMRQPPDFSGTWVATKDAPAGLAPAPAAPLGERFVIRQNGDALTLARTVRETTVSSPYVLDGRETRVRLPGGLCMGDPETVETAVREGDGFAVRTIGQVPAGGGTLIKRDITRTFRRTGADTLVVETRMMVQGKLAPVGTIYRRSGDAPAAAAPPQAKTPATLAQLAWLAGTWSGAMKETTVEERWTPGSGGGMLAVARTLRNGVMGSFEFLCIAERDGGLVYSAMPNGSSPATHFTLTKIDDHSATFENPAHDFPKMIRYARLPDGQLETTIAGEGGARPQSFQLKKQP